MIGQVITHGAQFTNNSFTVDKNLGAFFTCEILYTYTKSTVNNNAPILLNRFFC